MFIGRERKEEGSLCRRLRHTTLTSWPPRQEFWCKNLICPFKGQKKPVEVGRLKQSWKGCDVKVVTCGWHHYIQLFIDECVNVCVCLIPLRFSLSVLVTPVLLSLSSFLQFHSRYRWTRWMSQERHGNKWAHAHTQVNDQCWQCGVICCEDGQSGWPRASVSIYLVGHWKELWDL